MHKFRQKYIGDKAFYKRYLMLAIPMIIQNAITNLVSFLDNIMVGQIGTEQMSGTAIVNQLLFVFNLCIFGVLSGPGIFGAQFFGKGCRVRREFTAQEGAASALPASDPMVKPVEGGVFLPFGN